MSAHRSIDAVQVELHTPSLDEINPINTEPLLQTIAHGEIPSNYQINDSIDRMRESIEETKERAHLNAKGEKLVEDAEKLLDTAQRIINERNPHDSIQHLLKDSKDAASGAAHDASRQLSQFGHDLRHSLPHIPSKTDIVLNAIPAVANGLPAALSHLPNLASLDFSDLTKLINGLSADVDFQFPEELTAVAGDAKDAYNLLKEIALYAARSSEFRGLLSELVEFFHDAFGDLTGKLQEVGEAVKMDIDSKDVTMSATRDAAKKDGQELVAAAKDAHPIEASDKARKEVYDKFSTLMSKIADKPQYKKLLNLWMKYMDEIREKMDDYASKALDKAEELKDQAMEKGAELKDKAENLKDRAEKDASGVTDMVVEKTTEITDRAKETAKDLKDDAASRARQVVSKNSDAFDQVWKDVRDVVDNFGGKGTFDNFYIQTYNFYARLYNDKSARRFLMELRNFISESVHNPKSLVSDEKKGMELLGRGRALIQSERYRIMYNKYLSSWKNIITNFSDDKLVNSFTDQLRKFASDFALDAKGRPDIYAITESLGQIKSFIYPILMRQLENMTVAKIVGNSESYEYSIDHLSVGIANFVPECFDLRTKNHLKMNVKDLEAEQNNTRIVLDIKALKPHFNDVKFWYRRRAFPHIEDSGTVDVDLSSGEGTRIKVIWKIKSKHNRPYAFSLMEVKCVVDKVDIKIKNAQHDILDRIAASMFMGGIKHEIANGIVNAIVDVLHPLNDQMNKWFATRPIGQVTDKLNEKLHEAMEEAAEKANKVIQSHPVDRLVESVKDRIEGVEESVKDRVDMVIERTGQVANAAVAIKDSAAALKRKAEKTLSEENPGLRELKDAAVNKAIEFKDAAVEKGSELAEKAKEKGAEVAEKVKENLPTDIEDAKKKATELKDAAVAKGEEVLADAKEKYPEAAKKAEQLKDAAVEKGTEAVKKAGELKDAAIEKGSELAEKAKENMPTDLEDAKKKAGELKDAAVEKGTELAEKAKEKYPEAAKKAEQLKDAAVEKGAEVAKKAEQVKDAAVEKGTELAEKAKEKYPEAAKKAEELKDKAVEKGSEVVDKVKENMPKDVEDAKKKAGELKDAAVEKGSEVVEKVKENMPKDVEDAKKKAGELKDAAVEKGTELAEKAKEKYPEAAKKAEQVKDAAVEKGTELAEKAKEKGTEVAKKAEQVKDAAVEKGSELKDKASKAKDAAVEKGSELKDKASKAKDAAVEKGSELKEKAEDAMEDVSNELQVKDAPRARGVSYAAVASGDAQPAHQRKKAGKARKEHKWHSEWVKPNKTAHVTYEKTTVTETKEIIMEDKIASNPYEALSEENLSKKAT